jgi:hypothetical protein
MSSRSSRSRSPGIALSAATLVAGVVAVASFAAPAMAATTTLYASPTGSGTNCSSGQPCSLPGAQAAVRSMVAGMSDDIVIQLADGVYRLSAPLRFTAADSGTSGHTVRWQAASSAHPVLSGAHQITGWRLADASRNIWQAGVGTGIDTRHRVRVPGLTGGVVREPGQRRPVVHPSLG